MLGLDAPEAELREAFAAASGVGIVKGFAIGRTIFADAAERWLAGRLSDEGAVAEMSARFRRLCEAWDRGRGAEAGRMSGRRRAPCRRGKAARR